MPLDMNELQPIIDKVYEKVYEEIIVANRIGTLEVTLAKYGVDEETLTLDSQYTKGDTILVLGDLKIDKHDLNKLYKIFKLSEKNFEYVEYDDVTNYNFAKLIENYKYTDVFVGPVPHKAKDIGNHSSLIVYLTNCEDIPAKVTELKDSSGKLKLNKGTFRAALEESRLLNP